MCAHPCVGRGVRMTLTAFTAPVQAAPQCYVCVPPVLILPRSCFFPCSSRPCLPGLEGGGICFVPELPVFTLPPAEGELLDSWFSGWGCAEHGCSSGGGARVCNVCMNVGTSECTCVMCVHLCGHVVACVFTCACVLLYRNVSVFMCVCACIGSIQRPKSHPRPTESGSLGLRTPTVLPELSTRLVPGLVWGVWSEGPQSAHRDGEQGHCVCRSGVRGTC